MALGEDFNVFFNTDDFGVSATFTPRGGGAASTVKGIFDKEFIAVGDGGPVDIAATDPVFQCKTTDIPNARGGTLVIDGVTYNIVVAKPDGTGVSMLVLEDAS